MGNLSQSSSIGYFFGISASSWFLCVLFILSCQGASSPAVKKQSKGKSSIDVQKEKIITLIENAANKLPEERFEGDPVLHQIVDRPNSETRYKLPESTAVVYTRNKIDTRKSVVVLSPQEDHIMDNDKGTKQRKQTYVVLKQQRKKGQNNAYYATFAYLRKFLPNDDPAAALKVGNETLRIEWDTWTLRGNAMESNARTFGWITCSESVFVPCQKTTTSSTPGKGDGHDYSEEESSKDWVKDWGGGIGQSDAKNPTWGLNSVSQSNTKPSEFNSTHKQNWVQHQNNGSGTTEGGAVTETLDFFADLDDSPAEAKTVSAVLQVVTMQKFSSATPTNTTPQIHRKFNNNSKPTVQDDNLADGNIRDLIGGLANSTENDLVRKVLNTAMAFVPGFNDKYGRATTTAVASATTPEPRADIFSHLGWKTQGVSDLAKGSSGFADAPFVGFGTCPYRKQSATALDSLNTPKKAINFYLTSLRNQCSKRHRKHLLKLFNDKLLTINGDKTLSVPTANKILKTPKLTQKEIKDVSKAYEFAMLSQILAMEFRTPTVNSTAPDGSIISKNVFIIVSMALHTLTHTTRDVSAHFIVLSRNLVQTLKSANTKVLQDYKRLKGCQECTEQEKEIAKNDVFTLQAIRLYIITGIRADVLVEDAHADYQQFYQSYKDVIAAKTKSYL